MWPRKSTDKAAVPVPAGPRRKAQPDLYTVLLVLALVAVLVGILFLYLEMNAYDFKFDGGPTLTAVEASQSSLFSSAFSIQHSAFSLTPDP